ncbi:MAG: lipocalin family protein [Gammaproteobacteria bacterium]|nr:lipocalin family protein [Sideroxydans sp.]MBU3903724.1 lipocalin family protein [Gammaproteobacteria bacterium]MBU4044934.1 lipocalin family protein [Gammaproteobacteria bacterium]MBU4150310.1 lipocalin family protein [Gammaproteobacteria bacterium]
MTTCLTAAMLLWQSTAGAQPLQTVAEVDLQRYLGRWYEIASIPQYFQRQCVGDAMAEYAQAGEDIAVTNSCRTENGERSVAQGQARVVDAASRAKLEVTFVKFFGWLYLLGGDYWVIDLASDYRYAVVGHPDRDYAWILSRQPALPMPDLIAIEQRLRENGYDSCALLTTIQTGGLSEKMPLCKVVKKE